MRLFGKFECKKRGHDWNFSCKCDRCGEVRDEGHNWRAVNDKLHYCTNCRKSEPHVWDGCKCNVCGATKHTFGDDGFCIYCGQGKVVGYSLGKRTELRLEHCSRCGKKTPHLAVICNYPNDPNYGTAYRSDCIPCGSAPFCPKCNSYVSATTTRNEFDGAASAVCDCCGTVLWHE